MTQSALTDPLREAVSEKCGSIQSQKIAWERSLAKGLSAGASPEALRMLLGGFKSARTLDACLGGTETESGGIDGFLSDLRDLANESAFDLASWLAAFELVQSHLAANGRAASARSIVGYVQCSAEFGGSAENRQSLPEIIAEMLNQYGFEGQEGCGADPVG